MYAIVRTGGKQHIVTEGMGLAVEKLEGEVGSEVTLSEVLFVGGDGTPRIGVPFVDGAAVAAEIVEQGKGRKILVYKKQRRKGYEKRRGHRQLYTGLKITKISA